MMKKAQAGDEVSVLHRQGFALMGNGRFQEALLPLEQAAKLGDAEGMKDAGDACTQLGLETEARSWFDQAANAGNSAAMYSMGALAIRNGDRPGARQWFERSAEAGDSKAYAALTQLADDAAAERRWARLGAEAGDSSCMVSHGHHLVVDAADWGAGSCVYDIASVEAVERAARPLAPRRGPYGHRLVATLDQLLGQGQLAAARAGVPARGHAAAVSAGLSFVPLSGASVAVLAAARSSRWWRWLLLRRGWLTIACAKRRATPARERRSA